MRSAPRGAADDAARLRALCTLVRAPGLTPRGAGNLLARFGSPEEVTSAGRRALRAAGLADVTARWLEHPDAAALDHDLAWAAAPGNHVIGWGEAAYPSLLSSIPDAPPVLFVTGDPKLLCQPQLAVVGSRNPTPSGREIAHEFSAFASGAGLTVTSGLALGIDAAAHTGALDGGGTTLAVMGTGPERIYPSRHAALAERISQHGALLTEFPPGTPPLPAHFPRRNRIISGLALGTLVVEAALGSGSLITARCAVEQGREVFAVPGSILSPLSRGCHALIRDGATLVERPSDILAALGTTPLSSSGTPTEPEGGTTEADPEYRLLLDALGFHPVTADTVAERTGLTPQAVSSMLLILELRGEIEALPGSRYARRRPGHS